MQTLVKAELTEHEKLNMRETWTHTVHRHRADGHFPQRQMRVGDAALGHSILQDVVKSRTLAFETVSRYSAPLCLELCELGDVRSGF